MSKKAIELVFTCFCSMTLGHFLSPAGDFGGAILIQQTAFWALIAFFKYTEES